MSAHDAVAEAAARLIVDSGMEYGPAKRRAARDLGHRGELPGNELVEDQVREHLALFHADTQPAELRALREVALRWMRRLAEFRPHVGGAVWRGTATRLSIVPLDLYCDDPKAAEIALINAGVDYDVGSIDRPGREPVNVLVVADRGRPPAEPVTLRLALYDHDDLRGALKPDARGQPWRGDAAALQRLMDREDTR
jgi:hypothetical protein